MATLEELRYWCFGGDAPGETGTPLPDATIFRAMAYRFDPVRGAGFCGDYRRATLKDLPLTLETKSIAAAFRKEGIRFAPIKGAALAENCYPDPALRVRGDIDLLVHPDDIARAVKTAEAEGWRSSFKYKHESHCPSMYKKMAMLELHFNLPDFPSGSTPRVWETLVARAGSSEYRLPPELELVVAFHHSRHHRWNNGSALIADYAFLLKTYRDFDWKLAREYAAEFGVADPGVLCFALPELFPAEVMPPDGRPPEELRLVLRETVLNPVDLYSRRDTDVMNRSDRFSFSWWKDRLRGFSASSVRINYRLSEDAGFWRMTGGYLRMIGDKLLLAFRGMKNRDTEFIRAMRRADALDRGLSKLGK